MHPRMLLALMLALAPAVAGRAEDPEGIRVTDTEESLRIETRALTAQIRKRGYVSGVAQGTLTDRKTGAKDLGFGLHVMDFLLAPGWADDEYSREPKFHGNLAKHLVEGPQICTQAKQLRPRLTRGKDFLAVQLSHTFTQAGKGFRPGSTWEQTLVFLPDARHFFSAERVVSANDVENVSYRIDMPGHVRHSGKEFAQVYLSYHGGIPAKEFARDFAPDERFLYQRREGKVPERMIRAYQVIQDGTPGPWLAGITLDPAQVSEAWCHQRGYICFIQELHGRGIRKGEAMGAAYAVGWFDDVASMEKLADAHRGRREIRLSADRWELK